MTDPEYDAVRDSIAIVIKNSYPVPPGVARDMADAATSVLRAHDRHEQILTIGQQIVERDAEALRLLAE
jgi:hypothetical protein